PTRRWPDDEGTADSHEVNHYVHVTTREYLPTAEPASRCGGSRWRNPMITGELKSKVDRIWDSFWSGGISNPLEVMEQITYLLFLRRLDELQQLEENKANRLGTAIERRFYPEGKDSKGRDHKDLRWSRFKHMAPSEMYNVVSEHVFPFLRTLGSNTGYAKHMKDARFTIPTPALLAKVVDMVDKVPMEDRDTK